MDIQISSSQWKFVELELIRHLPIEQVQCIAFTNATKCDIFRHRVSWARPACSVMKVEGMTLADSTTFIINSVAFQLALIKHQLLMSICSGEHRGH